MAKFIAFGKINKQYKYIIIHISLILASQYFFSDSFPEQMRPKIFDIDNYPPIIFVQRFFNYLGGFIFSIAFLFYQKYQKKKVKAKKVDSEKNAGSSHIYELIYEEHGPVMEIKKICFIIFLSIVFFHIVNILRLIGCTSLFFYEFNLFFMLYINFLVFGAPLYSHKKFAVIIEIIFSSIFKVLSAFEYIYNDNHNLIYKNHIFIIPIVVISYLLIILIRFYSLFKIKWLLDYKFIPMDKFLVLYNFIGIVIFLFAAVISSLIKCVDKTTLNDIDLICLIKQGDDYYFDSFSYFFEKLWSNQRTTSSNIFYLFLFFLGIILNTLRVIYFILIIRNLSPEYYSCSYDLYFTVTNVMSLIKAIIKNVDIKVEIYNLLAEIGALIAILIYLEIIELKFCNLNHDLKNHIENRGIDDYNINNIYNETDDDENIRWESISL